MPRNRSEKPPKVLLEKKVRPALWDGGAPVQLIEFPEEVYRVQIREADIFRFAMASRYSDALDVYDLMVDGFYFSSIHTSWNTEHAA